MVVKGGVGCGRDADRGLGGGTDGVGGGDGRDRDGDRYGDGYGLNWWEDNAENRTLGTEPNYTLDYAMGLEHYNPITSKTRDPGIWLEREKFQKKTMKWIISCNSYVLNMIMII